MKYDMRDKRDLDDTDLDILRLLSTNSRRPFSDIADRVGLSPPAVSDRIDRLQEQGVIRRFTVDVDRLTLQRRTPVIIEFNAKPTQVDEVYRSVRDLHGIEHVFRTYDGTIIAHGNAPENDLRRWLHDGIEMDHVHEFDIKLVDEYEWSVEIDAVEFALSCAVCDNTVGSDGVTADIGGETKAFCCPSCRAQYEQQYASYQSNA